MDALAARIRTIPPLLYDVLELRLDHCADLNIQQLGTLPFPLPVLMTLRPKDQGGAYQGSEVERLTLLLELARLQPAWLDVEYTVPPEHVARIQAASPGTQVILSYHNFTHTPENLDGILAGMRRTAFIFAQGSGQYPPASGQHLPGAPLPFEYTRKCAPQNAQKAGRYGEISRGRGGWRPCRAQRHLHTHRTSW